MEDPHTSDFLVRLLAKEMRVVTLGGIAVISHGLSRNTYDADIWVDPLHSADEWCTRLFPLLTSMKRAQPVMIGTWDSLSWEALPSVIEEYGVFRVNGLERPVDIFRKPNELPIEEFDRVWTMGISLEDGTRIPDVIDLLVTKQDTGRTKDTQDIAFLEAKAEEQYLAELPGASAEKAAAMLSRFFTPKVAETALAHPEETIRQLGQRYLLELAADGDPFAAEIVKDRHLSGT